MFQSSSSDPDQGGPGYRNRKASEHDGWVNVFSPDPTVREASLDNQLSGQDRTAQM